MAKPKKIDNKEIRENRSSNCYSNYTNKEKIDKIKLAKNIIRDLECHGPAGLIHISVLSDIIGKSIQIWNANGNLNRIIGKEKTGRPINIEYHTINSEQIGHWTLKYGKDPDKIFIDLNSCLFSVIGSQIGQNPSELRKWTVLNLKSNFQKFVNQVDKILRLKKNGKIILMIGGARYIGTSPNHAGIILDKSENQRAYGYSSLGHPRKHASHPSDISVENYSKETGFLKTGFLSRADQDYVIHLALKTNKAQKAIAELNTGLTTTTVILDAEELRNSRNILPKAREYFKGEPIIEGDIKQVVLVLRHHENQFKNPNADVFVLTCYPKIYNTVTIKKNNN